MLISVINFKRRNEMHLYVMNQARINILATGLQMSWVLKSTDNDFKSKHLIKAESF